LATLTCTQCKGSSGLSSKVHACDLVRAKKDGTLRLFAALHGIWSLWGGGLNRSTQHFILEGKDGV
jgi:hypothetical protein